MIFCVGAVLFLCLFKKKIVFALVILEISTFYSYCVFTIRFIEQALYFTSVYSRSQHIHKKEQISLCNGTAERRTLRWIYSYAERATKTKNTSNHTNTHTTHIENAQATEMEKIVLCIYAFKMAFMSVSSVVFVPILLSKPFPFKRFG